MKIFIPPEPSPTRNPAVVHRWDMDGNRLPTAYVVSDAIETEAEENRTAEFLIATVKGRNGWRCCKTDPPSCQKEFEEAGCQVGDTNLEGKRFLVWEHGDFQQVAYLDWEIVGRKRRVRWRNDEGVNIDPEFWMPLPEAPKQ